MVDQPAHPRRTTVGRRNRTAHRRTTVTAASLREPYAAGQQRRILHGCPESSVSRSPLGDQSQPFEDGLRVRSEYSTLTDVERARRRRGIDVEPEPEPEPITVSGAKPVRAVATDGGVVAWEPKPGLRAPRPDVRTSIPTMRAPTRPVARNYASPAGGNGANVGRRPPR